MRRSSVCFVALAQFTSLTVGTLAFADDTTSAPTLAPTTTVTTPSSPVTTQTMPTATPAPAPSASVVPVGASTTTTTQAAIDLSPSAPVTPGSVSTTEYSGETTSGVNRPLLGTGLVLFGGTYAASAIVGAESSNGHDNPNLYIPVAGPWIDLAQRGPGAGDKVLLAFDGVGQGLGALAIVTSVFIPEKKSRHWLFVGNDNVQVAPTQIGLGGYGLGAVGKF